MSVSTVSHAMMPCAAAVLAAVLSCAGYSEAKQLGAEQAEIPAVRSAQADRTYFYVGGRYVGDPGKEVMQGSMYVEVLTPQKISQRWPLVFFHGAAQTATNWIGTPDGRKGWADYFVAKGYLVYLVDQPARGRSSYQPGLDGTLKTFSAPAIESLFTATRELGTWPQAKLHTQWPGNGPKAGRMGDAVFDAFYRTQVAFLASNAETQTLVQDAGAALLDRIGPAILVTHSQAGAFGWLIADKRPSLVKGIVALEPLGPPFQDAVLGSGKARPWGPTDVPLTYEPAVADPSELAIERQAAPDAPDLEACWLQKGPVRKLPNLAGKPVLIAVGEASYHAVYDHCTASYLKQAGVNVDFVRLADRGIRGNGHMSMLERNNVEIATLLDRWIKANVGP